MLKQAVDPQTGPVVRPKNYNTGTTNTILGMVVAAVLLSIWFVYLYNHYFGPAPTAPVTATEQKNSDYIHRIYKESGGDYSKLSDDDKAKMEKMAGGMAQTVFHQEGSKP